MAVKTTVSYQGKLICEAIHEESGSKIRTEAPRDNGGEGTLFSPTDLIGAGLASCILTIMGKLEEREKIDLKGTSVEVVKVMTEKPLRRIDSFKLKVHFPAGLVLTEAQKIKLRGAASSCPVKASLHPDIKIEIEYLYT